MLTSTQKERLTKLFQVAFLANKGGWTLQHVFDEIDQILPKKSFSEAILDAGEYRRKCDLGKWHSIYRLTFRTVLIPALRHLVEADQPMTTQQLIDVCEPNVGRMVGKYVSELRHWKLIEETDRGWKSTSRADAFLQGLVKIPSWTWPKEEPLPTECMDGPLKYIQELTDDHPKEDKGQHLEDAALAESLQLTTSAAQTTLDAGPTSPLARATTDSARAPASGALTEVVISSHEHTVLADSLLTTDDDGLECPGETASVGRRN